MNLIEWLASLQDSATPDIDECIDILGSHIDLLHALITTEQDAQWHAEGNVHIHTNMVLLELYQLLAKDAAHLVGEQRQAIILAALLHDIAKPICSKPYELDGVERIGAPQHAFIGRSYLSFKLAELELSSYVIWTVLNLVGEHHTPKILVVKSSPISDYYALARQSNTELLYWLEVADVKGRLCPDPEALLQQLEEFRLFAEDYKVWGNELDIHSQLEHVLTPLPQPTQEYIYAHAIMQMETGKIHMAEEAIATTYQHRDNHPHLVVLCGPSGSGKSTWQKQHFPGYEVVSLDSLRQQFNGDAESQKNKGQITQFAKEQLRVELRKKGQVIWDATNLRKDFRSVICGLGQDYHALVTLVVFLLPESDFFKKNRLRQRRVPEKVLYKQLSSYQFPLLSEAHQVQFVNRDGEISYQSGYFRKQ